MRSFGSDNHSGIHPDILAAIADANKDHAVAYGNDPYTARLREMFRGIFGPDADGYPVFNGTGANVMSIRSVTRPTNAVICAATAHIYENECGAPEAHTGCKLKPVATPDGKLTPELIIPMLHGMGSEHYVQPKVISITQPTELGTIYTVEEIKRIADLAHANDMYLHMDGARLGNATAALGIGPREFTTEAGVDILSFGGTKNGMMIGEAVIYLRPGICAPALFERKQLMQLCSKMRFISAQFIAYLTDDLWLRLAKHSNDMASLLSSRLSECPEVEVLQRTEANGVFVKLPAELARKLTDHYFFNHNIKGETATARWMCSFDTTGEDIDNFISLIKEFCPE